MALSLQVIKLAINLNNLDVLKKLDQFICVYDLCDMILPTEAIPANKLGKIFMRDLFHLILTSTRKDFMPFPDMDNR